jgi:L-serine dehydratase
MRAAKCFIETVIKKNLFNEIKSIKCDYYGSLALTGKGHGTDKAFILGVQGYTPETIDSNSIPGILENVQSIKKLDLKFGNDTKTIVFNPKKDIKFHRRVNLSDHPNGMAFAVFDKNNKELFREIYFSVGGGFILTESEIRSTSTVQHHTSPTKFPFNNAKELLIHCSTEKLSISELIFQNELTWKTETQIFEQLDLLWSVMQKCIYRGFKNEGILPGGLEVKRRAPNVHKKLIANPEKSIMDSLSVLDWVNLYALSVNEENAGGGQVVTAPTNGAAGILPAVIEYYVKFIPHSSQNGVRSFLLTAGAIAILYKKNASISGAEVGCQGEVGVACSMAAGALCEVLGGSVEQVENAAEIAMEHNLGLTCDPIGGLVQIPCIERNAMGAIKAINAARMALQGDGTHYVSLDKVIHTMKETGKDMKKQYKETSRGGLAVNIPEC